MKDLAGSVALLTGASRGIGVQIAHALAHRGVRLALAARSADELAAVTANLKAIGAQVIAIPTDVTDPAALDHLVAETLRVYGVIDLLINNAGIVMPSPYVALSREDIERQIAVNLTAPMTLTHRILPLMQARKRGHIVNVASLGGLLGVAWGEPYGATKHGLVGFTRSLRAFLRATHSPVSTSVICPGFVEAVGMYADKATQHGHRAPAALGTSPPEAVVEAVIDAILRDRPEIVVSSRPIRLMLALGALSPRFSEWLLRKLGTHRLFEVMAQTPESR